MLTYHGVPSTPPRCSNIFDNTISSHVSLNCTLTGDLGLYSVGDDLGSSPCFDPSLLPHFDSSSTNFDLASTWGQVADNSPITFSSPSMQLVTQESSPISSPYGHDRRRVAMDGPQLRSSMLKMQTMDLLKNEDLMSEEEVDQFEARFNSMHSHMPQTPTKSRTSKQRSNVGRSATRGKTGHKISRDSHNTKKGHYKVVVEEAARHGCNAPDCTKTFRRAEHLKRHQQG